MRPVGPWAAFRAGLVQTVRLWPLWLPFYATMALLAGLLLVPVARGLSNWIGHTLAAAELADGLDVWLLVEILQSEMRWMAWLVTMPVWPFLLTLPFSILSAGALEIYRRGEQRISWPDFWRTTRQFTPSFTLLLFIDVLLIEGSFVLVFLLAGFVGTFSFSAMLVAAAVGLAVLIGLGLLVQWWIAYARVRGVALQDRNVWRMLKGSAAFLWRNIGPAAGLSLLNFPLSFLAPIGYLLLSWPLPDSWWGARVVIQQLLILLRMGVRLVRLSAEMQLVLGRDPSAAPTEAGRHPDAPANTYGRSQRANG